MTDIDRAIKKIRKWEAEASPGPWRALMPLTLYDARNLARVGEPEIPCFIADFYSTRVPREERHPNARLAALGRNCILPLVEVADGYEQWEAAMLESQQAWADGRRALPLLTQELWDTLLALQGQRNAALALVAAQVEKLKDGS